MNQTITASDSLKRIFGYALSILACAALVLTFVPMHALAAGKEVAPPSKTINFVYDGGSQVAISADDGYVLSVVSGGGEIDGKGNAVIEDAGTYVFKAELETDYTWVGGGTDAVESTVTVEPFSIESPDVNVYASPATYTGSPVTPAVKVMFGDRELVEGTDYTVLFQDNVKVGEGLAIITGTGNFKSTKVAKFEISEKVAMYRLYNPNSGEHFYTSNTDERDKLKKVGWIFEGVGWYAPKNSETPVYRVYNPVAGEHHYTISAEERDMLVKAGWKDEGIGWYSDDLKTVKVLREYNPNQFACNHNYTTSKAEHDGLVALGWLDEGIGWYAVAAA